MASSSDSMLSDAGIFVNLRSSTRRRTVAQQARDTVSIQAEPDPDTIPRTFEELPRVSINTPKGLKEYVKAELLNTRYDRRSGIWDYGYDLVEAETKAPYWKCIICDEKHKETGLFKATSTSGPERHLDKDHRIRVGKKRTAGVAELDGVEDVTSTFGTVPPSSTAGSSVYDMLVAGAKSAVSLLPGQLVERFKQALILWIVSYQISLAAVENHFFRDLLSLCSSNLAACLPKSANTVRKWIMEDYEMKKATLITDIQLNTESAINVSFDLWTSSNSLAFMAVVIHYIDKSYKVRTRLIAMRRVYGGHSGENQAKLLVEILREFELTDRLGYFVSDNATSNDSCIDILLKTLKPDLSADKRTHRRLRCYGHILNLAANAYIWGKDSSSFDRELVINNTLELEQAELHQWRKHGPVGMLHNTVVFIKRSPQRREQFSDIAEDDEADLELVQDNATRWNSAFLMIRRAIQLMDQLIGWMASNEHEKDEKKKLPKEDRLKIEDWRVLTETREILQPFYDQTKHYQSRAKNGTHGALWEMYLSMELILNEIITSKERYIDVSGTYPHPDDDDIMKARKHTRTSLDNCWGKLDDYYKKFDLAPVYAAALVLHPGYKWRYFEKNWIQDHQVGWLEATKARVRTLWEENYQHLPEAEFQPRQPLPQPQPRRVHEPNPRAQYIPPPDFYDEEEVASARGEYEEYINSPPKRCEVPLEWWKAHREEYPRLSKMALDLFSIPMMSAECERVFSSAKTLITERRNGLKEDIIEACTLLRYWIREEAFR